MSGSKVNLLIGGAFILFGIILFGQLVHIALFNNAIERFWPGILVLSGLLTISQPGNSAKAIGGSMLWLGFLMILRRIGAFDGNGGLVALMLLLVLSGLLIVALTIKPTSKIPPPSSDTESKRVLS